MSILEKGSFLLPNWLSNDAFYLSPPSKHHLTIENIKYPPTQSVDEPLSFGFRHEFKIMEKKSKVSFSCFCFYRNLMDCNGIWSTISYFYMAKWLLSCP